MPGEPDEQTQAGEDTNTDDDAQTQGDDTTDTEADDFDKPRALSTIKQLRAVEKSLQKQLKDALASRKAIEDANKTEQEKKDAELARLQKLEADVISERRVTTARNAFTAAATKAGAVKPDALFKLADNLELDDDGKPTNADSVIKSLRGEYPELFNTSSADGSSGKGSSAKPVGMNELIRQSMIRR